MTKTKSPLASFLKVSLDILIAVAAIMYIIIIVRVITSKPDFSSIKNIITYSLFLVGGGGLYAILFNLRKIEIIFSILVYFMFPRFIPIPNRPSAFMLFVSVVACCCGLAIVYELNKINRIMIFKVAS